MSKDLSNWVRRDGAEIVLGPERSSGSERYPWQYVWKTPSGGWEVEIVTDTGSSITQGEKSSEDLIPPPEWVYCSVSSGGVIWDQSERTFSNATHRYIKGDPTTMEVVPDD